MVVPFLCALAVLLAGPRLRTRHSGILAVGGSLVSCLAAWLALTEVAGTGATQLLHLDGWETGLAIRLRLTPLSALLLLFTAVMHVLIGLYAALSRQGAARDFWPLSCFLHGSLVALWLSADLFNLYITLELLALTAVAMVALSGPAAYKPAANYLILSLTASLFYLRSEEHTSELQSRPHLVCRLLLEKKKSRLARTTPTWP